MYIKLTRKLTVKIHPIYSVEMVGRSFVWVCIVISSKHTTTTSIIITDVDVAIMLYEHTLSAAACLKRS